MGTPRQNDVIAWSELTVVLDGAAAHLADDDPWYEGGHDILTALLRAYTAHNTVAILTDTPAAAAVETLVAPVIEDAFLQHEHRQRFLQHALAHDEEIRDDPAAQQLLAGLLNRTKTPPRPRVALRPSAGPARPAHPRRPATGRTRTARDTASGTAA